MRIRAFMAAVAAAATLAQVSQAQSAVTPPRRFGIAAGYNSTTVGGSDADNVSRRSGFLVGGYIVAPSSASFALQPEILYTRKGADVKDTDVPSATASLKMSYIEIPVLGRFDFNASGGDVRPFLYVGPALAFKLTCDFSVTAPGFNESSSCDDPSLGDANINSVDFSAIGGAGIAFNLGGRAVTFSARYDHSFTKISSEADIKHRVISLIASIELPFAR